MSSTYRGALYRPLICRGGTLSPLLHALGLYISHVVKIYAEIFYFFFQIYAVFYFFFRNHFFSSFLFSPFLQKMGMKGDAKAGGFLAPKVHPLTQKLDPEGAPPDTKSVSTP